MNDRDLMENLLLLEKGVCDLFLHGAIESVDSRVQRTFSSSLNSSLDMQSKIYDKMMARGWYTAENADQNQLQSLKMKFSGQQGNTTNR